MKVQQCFYAHCMDTLELTDVFVLENEIHNFFSSYWF